MMLDEFNLINNLIKWMSPELKCIRNKREKKQITGQGNRRINMVHISWETEREKEIGDGMSECWVVSNPSPSHRSLTCSSIAVRLQPLFYIKYRKSWIDSLDYPRRRTEEFRGAILNQPFPKPPPSDHVSLPMFTVVHHPPQIAVIVIIIIILKRW